MLTPDQFLAFLAASILITVSPGPDNLMVLATGISKGRSRGMAFGLGAGLGCLSHTILAVVGVSALIAASPTAFTALKIAGGAYLIWLGIRAIRSSGKIELKSSEVESGTTFSFFLKGIFANAINPKVILFFLSFLPQFVIAQNGAVTWQIAALGVTFTVQAAILFTLLGYFSGYVGQWLAANRRVGLWLDRLAGAVFVGLGLRLVLAR